MKKIWRKIENFFIDWFYWKWRAKKYDRDSNKYRSKAFKFILEMHKNGHYIYLGFGSVLKYLRDGHMKNQDIDIIISKKSYESKLFKKLLKKYNLKKWQEIFFNKEIKVDKYIADKKAPFEFFICDDNENMEKTYSAYNKESYVRTIEWQKLKVFNTKFGEIIFPEYIKKYVIDIYGENYIKSIGFKFNFTKHTNMKTLKKGPEKVSYREY